MTHPTQKADKRKHADASNSDADAVAITTKKSKGTTSKVSWQPVSILLLCVQMLMAEIDDHEVQDGQRACAEGVGSAPVEEKALCATQA